jgi:hypothetical protein
MCKSVVALAPDAYYLFKLRKLKQNFAVHSSKLPTGMITYWLIGRKAEAELTTVVSIQHPDTVTNGSGLNTRR